MKFKYLYNVSYMLDINYDQNYYSPLVCQKTMNSQCTYQSIHDVCQSLINEYIPYDLFKLIWNELNIYDKIIYDDDEIENEEVEHLYAEFVAKGAYKYGKNNKKRTKLRKSIRYKCFDDE